MPDMRKTGNRRFGFAGAYDQIEVQMPALPEYRRYAAKKQVGMAFRRWRPI